MVGLLDRGEVITKIKFEFRGLLDMGNPKELLMDLV